MISFIVETAMTERFNVLCENDATLILPRVNKIRASGNKVLAENQMLLLESGQSHYKRTLPPIMTLSIGPSQVTYAPNQFDPVNVTLTI